MYRNHEVRALAEIAHERGLAVHMDGARFANALARLNCSPAEATWKAGVDVLSFGATKNGAMAAEAVVFFDPARAQGMPSRRKRGGHLFSKHRFVAAQLDAYLRDGLWLALARHANAMASRLAEKLAAIQIHTVWPVEANELFVALSPGADSRLKAAGATYYPWPANDLPAGRTLPPGHILVRLVTSFATTEADADRFAALAAGERDKFLNIARSHHVTHILIRQDRLPALKTRDVPFIKVYYQHHQVSIAYITP